MPIDNPIDVLLVKVLLKMRIIMIPAITAEPTVIEAVRKYLSLLAGNNKYCAFPFLNFLFE